MFKIADGREYFYQWDLDRQVTVDDTTITEVHFCNRTDECSLVVEVIDGLANVPNILLQNSFDIRVFGYDGKATRFDKVFKVKPRTQPSDYIYTETAIKSIEEILTAAEQVGTITNEFYEFVDEYKLTLVDDGQGNVELKAVEREPDPFGPTDLSNYYTKAETEILIADAVESIDIPEVDLTEYAKKEDIPDISGKADKEHTHSEYLTEHQDLSEYAKKTDIPTVPTKVSAFENDKGYLTSHQSLVGYATEQYVTNAITTAFEGITTAEGGAY